MPSDLAQSNDATKVLHLQVAAVGAVVGDAAREVVAKAIATELAPEVAIALLSKAEQPADAPELALQPIAAGVSSSGDESKIRVSLLFENGSVLPVELSRDAGEALIHGLEDELEVGGRPTTD